MKQQLVTMIKAPMTKSDSLLSLTLTFTDAGLQFDRQVKLESGTALAVFSGIPDKINGESVFGMECNISLSKNNIYSYIVPYEPFSFPRKQRKNVEIFKDKSEFAQSINNRHNFIATVYDLVDDGDMENVKFVVRSLDKNIRDDFVADIRSQFEENERKFIDDFVAELDAENK